MHLTANAETIDRLVMQGVLLVKAFHVEHANDPTRCHAEFLRGEFTGWRNCTHGVPRLGGRNRGPRSRQNVRFPATVYDPGLCRIDQTY
jgi:hypothetical protein